MSLEYVILHLNPEYQRCECRTSDFEFTGHDQLEHTKSCLVLSEPEAGLSGLGLSRFIRLRRRPRACPWMNAKRHHFIATARCHPNDRADNRGVAEGEAGYFNGTTGLPVGIH